MPAEKGLLSDDGGSPSKRNRGATSKTRLGVMLKQTIIKKSSNQKAELEELKLRWQQMQRQMKVLGIALTQRHDALVSTGKARAAVAKAFCAMSSDTVAASPLQAQTGEWSTDDDVATGPSPSYAHSMSAIDLQAESRANEFKVFAVDYFAQWQDTVTARIASDMKQTDQYRRDVDHYQAKVESLTAQKKRQEEKKKPVKNDLLEKLKRNQEKLEEADIVYENAALDLFLLMEELVDRSWRDLHPLFLSVLEWDVNTTNDDLTTLDDIKTMIDELQHLEDQENISHNRMEDVAKESAKNLSTRPGGVDPTNLSFGDNNNNNNGSSPKGSSPEPVAVEMDGPLPGKEEKEEWVPQPGEESALQFDPTKDEAVYSPRKSETNPFGDDDDDDDAPFPKPKDDNNPFDKNPFGDDDDNDDAKDDDNNNNPFDDDDDDGKAAAAKGGAKSNPFDDDEDDRFPKQAAEDGTNPFDDDDDKEKSLRRPSIGE